MGGGVETIEPLAGYPDTVYAANGAPVVGIVYSAKFRHTERAAEGPAYRSGSRFAGT